MMNTKATTLFVLLLAISITETSIVHQCNEEEDNPSDDLGFSVASSWVNSLQEAYSSYWQFKVESTKQPRLSTESLEKFQVAADETFVLVKDTTIDTIDELKEIVSKLCLKLSKAIAVGNQAMEDLAFHQSHPLAGLLSMTVYKFELALGITANLVPFIRNL